VDGRSGTGQIVDLIHLQVNGVDDVMADELEAWIAHQVQDVGLASREEVVQAQDIVPLGEETVTEMRAEKSGTTGDEDTFHR
jgi:hypothetical protein